MSWLNHFSRRAPRVCCIGLDGVPHSLLQRALSEHRLPRLAALVAEGTLRRMHSVHPWLSSVAWTTLQTGVNPGKHGLYGFIDRDPATMKTYIPLANRIKAPAVWDWLGRAGKQVIVLNVPVTYPVTPVNGILVSGFLAPTLTPKAVYPSSKLELFQQLGYRIDTDPQLARQDRLKMLDDIRDALARRMRTFLHLLDHEPWDLFFGVIMETDRLHHFFFEPMEAGDPAYAPAFWDIYCEIDEFLGQVRARLDERDTLIMMSDHGFCTIRQEVFYNHWLAGAGYLKYTAEPATGIEHLHPDSAAYDMDPGRIFINLKGRERTGRIEPGAAYERLRDEIIAAAEALTVPGSGTSGDGAGIHPVLKAFRREEIYHGPCVDEAADIILAPVNGYDPKGAFYKNVLAHKDTVLNGMHTFDDAFVYVSRPGPAIDHADILDLAPTIMAASGQPIPVDFDGQPLIS